MKQGRAVPWWRDSSMRWRVYILSCDWITIVKATGKWRQEGWRWLGLTQPWGYKQNIGLKIFFPMTSTTSLPKVACTVETVLTLLSDKPGCKMWLQQLLAVWLWARHLTFSSLCFLRCKKRTIIFTLKRCVQWNEIIFIMYLTQCLAPSHYWTNGRSC